MNKVEAYLVAKGFDLDVLKKDVRNYQVTNMKQAAAYIKEAIASGRHIHLVGDYDCDGVMAICILYLAMTELGADFSIRFPKKMSEGYGISEKIVGEIPDGSLVVTIDNGIAALEAIDLANSRGMDVVILDHHQIRGDGLLPNAKCTVDPHIYKEEGEFEHYCGAGLGYMLTKELGLSEETVKKAMVFAAIATIQDVVPMVEDNRNIVKYGLQALNAKAVDIPGLYSLCGALKLVPTTDVMAAITEEDIGFQIGPCINAMGRMLDDGAHVAFERIMHYDIYGEDGIRELVEWNQKRKDATAKQQNILEMLAETTMTKKTTCMVLYAEGLHEGIIGINAARVCEKYNMPAIVLTNSHEDGILKGSARSIEGVNMKDLLDQVADHVYKYGGHAGAAGLSVELSELEAFTKAINAITPKMTASTNTWQYDIEIEEKDVAEMLTALREYAPYGEEFRAPVFRVNNYNLIKSFGQYYRFIGENGVSLNGPTTEAVSFSLKEKFRTSGSPLNLNVVGTIGYSRYKKKPQIMLNDFQPIIKQQSLGFLV
ncbi:MAG: DHH family phosphoesterase [Agathobacter sp.]|nr:DHH family phosphoesterase [Agathobacter sp.]